MRRHRLLWLIYVFAWSLITVISQVQPTLADTRLQVTPSPTPNADGLILVTVQSGDTLWSVAARAGLTLEQLLALNEGLTETSFIQPGQQLIIGRVAVSPTPTFTATPGPTTTPPAAATPAPTSEPQGGTICLTAFDDVNQNGLHDVGEGLRPAVAFTITNADTQSVVNNTITDEMTETHCVEGLAVGNYLVTRSQITNEVMTTPDSWAVALVDDTVTTLVFGSFINVAAATSATTLPPVRNTLDNTGTETPPTETVPPAGNNLLRGIVILIVILAVLLLVAVLVVIISARRSAI